jgi:hypothetical protein
VKKGKGGHVYKEEKKKGSGHESPLYKIKRENIYINIKEERNRQIKYTFYHSYKQSEI